MSGLGPYLLPAFLLLLLVWFAISAALVVSRVMHDKRRLSPSGIETLAADSLTPKHKAEELAGYLIQSSQDRLLIQAASHRGARSKQRRIAALRILALANDSSAIPLLDRALHDPDADIIAAAIAALGGMSEESAARVLVDALRRPAFTRSRIATQLDRFPAPISHLIRPLLKDPVAPTRFWAATLLNRYPGNSHINKELMRLRDDPDPGVRKAAVETLGRIGGPHAVDTAVALLEDRVWYVRAHAARALGDLQQSNLSRLVIPLLGDREWWVRVAARETLEAMGIGVADEVIPCLSSTDLFVRNGAAEIFQNLGVLDSLIQETVQSVEPNLEHVGLLGKILAAGGPEFAAAAFTRTDAAAAAHVMCVLQQRCPEYRLAG